VTANEKTVPVEQEVSRDEETPTREELTDALGAALNEIERLEALNAQLERQLALMKLILNIPKKPRRIVRHGVPHPPKERTK